MSEVIKKQSLDRNEMKNYRPISNIPYLGKLIEKAVTSQLHTYIEGNHLAEPLQSAYRIGHGTETALIKVQNDILCALDQQMAVYIVLLDLSAAFDTLDFDIMLERFQNRFGITGSALNWFDSYFRHRKYHVTIAGVDSVENELLYGAPQGSVIGPLSFVMYVRPLGDILRKHGVKFHMYADDTQIYIPFNPKIPGNSESALAKLKDCISEVQQWMLVNKLKLNQDKTEFLLIASPNHHRLLSNTRLLIDPNTVIHPSPFVRNLGVVFDKFMNMDEHVTQMCKSVNYHIRNLSRIRRYIDKDTCHTAVRALITSRLDYCNSLLNGITNKNMVRLQSLQNKAARLVYMTPKHTPTSPLIVKLHWLRIPQRIQYKILTIVFNSIHKEAPQYINELLHTYDSTYHLRSSKRTSLVIPKTHKRAGDRSFSYIAPKLWNSLPPSLANKPSNSLFKKHLKSHLFQ